jgi:hypothetical protein
VYIPLPCPFLVKLTFKSYSDYDPNTPLAVPFHEDCFLLLSKVIYRSLHGKVPEDLSKGESLTGKDGEALGFVSKEALYGALKRLYVRSSYDHCLTNVDYGELQEMVKEQYWFCVRGHEVSFSLTHITTHLENWA